MARLEFKLRDLPGNTWINKIHNYDAQKLKLQLERRSEDEKNKLEMILEDLREIATKISVKDPDWLTWGAGQYGDYLLAALEGNMIEGGIHSLYRCAYYTGVFESSTLPKLNDILTRVRSNAIKEATENGSLSDFFNNQFETKFSEKESDLVELKNKIEEDTQTAENLIETLQAAAGKIFARDYAIIFEKQAHTHSSPFRREKNSETENGRNVWKSGAAEIWITVGFLLVILTCGFVFWLDDLITISKDENIYKAVAHLASRAIIVSVLLFLISFSFKQYRVQKHLATLNKHRANTLQSYDFLNAALDKSDGSANAILMKVAETIYASGQTGYVYDSESRGDLPTLIDMSKIVNPGKEV